MQRFTNELRTAEARVQSGHASFAPVVDVQEANVKAITAHLAKMSGKRTPAKKKAPTVELN